MSGLLGNGGMVKFPSGAVWHIRLLRGGLGPRTACGLYGDPRGGFYDLTGDTRGPMCKSCKKAMSWRVWATS